MAARGVERTLITETVSMATSAAAAFRDAAPVLVSIKAVDPSKYPYYGEVKLDPPMPLAQALTAGFGGRRRGSADSRGRQGGREGPRGRAGFPRLPRRSSLNRTACREA